MQSTLAIFAADTEFSGNPSTDETKLSEDLSHLDYGAKRGFQILEFNKEFSDIRNERSIQERLLRQKILFSHIIISFQNYFPQLLANINKIYIMPLLNPHYLKYCYWIDACVVI
ncbi:hypothetical protein JTB14_033495 [Gonioctena quinquepunctata]|nr:hypothetical protein JTB14_033495 [Gonioctena quinquepunctata]